ncbi:TPA: type 1 fimbrial protein [Klebsiella oxytoca]|nr:type 1 fimbrial protein [Klebsiella oxytoca]
MPINRIFIASVIAGIFSFLPPAWSECHLSDKEEAVKVNLTLPTSINVPSDTPAQTVVWSSDWTAKSSRKLQCEPDESLNWRVETTLPPDNTAGPGAYITGSKNFALRITYRDRKAQIPTRVLRGQWRARTANMKGLIDVQPEYKIDVITKRSLTPGIHTIGGGVVALLVSDHPVSLLTINASSMEVSSAGCNVIDDNIIVRLGRHDVREFFRKRATEYVPFSIRLDCNKNVKISYSISGRSADGLSLGILSLDNDVDSAKGIGVQIVDEYNHPITLNRLVFWKKTKDEDYVTLQLKSRYMRISQKIKPGQANATATLSFVYR